MQQSSILDPAITTKIQEMCIAQFPQEACGIVANNKIIVAKNIALNPTQNFTLDPKVWAKVKKADFIWHSHTNNSDLSFADIQTCKQLKIPMYLFSLPIGSEYYYDPNKITPLLGRKFVYWVADCWSLVKDWYQLEMGIVLDDYPREFKNAAGVYFWDQEGWDVYRQMLPTMFNQYPPDTPLERGDLALMTMRWQSPKNVNTPNHLAVMDNPERSEILHHLYGQLSKREVYGDELRRQTESVWKLRK